MLRASIVGCEFVDVVLFADEGIMLRTERIGIDVLLVPGPEPDLITDQGHVLIHVQDRDRVHVPKGTIHITYSWK